MLLGFRERFAPFVLDGSKTHTIRAARAKMPHVGEICHCYANPRQKTMRLLGRFPCVKVETIQIYERGDGTFGCVIGETELTPAEKDCLAWCDGFRFPPRRPARAFVEMIRYWTNPSVIGVCRVNVPSGEPLALKPCGLAFTGMLIHWSPPRKGTV